MCECLSYSDGTLHLCEACAGDLAHYKGECERLGKRCAALHEALRTRVIYSMTSSAAAIQRMCCSRCGATWRPDQPESHAPGCLCAPEAGPEFDETEKEKSR